MARMDVDKWVRRGALGAVLLVGVAIYFLRSDPRPAEAPVPPASGSAEPAPVADGIPALRPSAVSASELGARGEAALAQRDPPPEPSLPRTSRHHAPRSRSAIELEYADEGPSSPESAPRGPCGGIEARLITTDEDPAWTFASLAPPGEPAMIRHVGDRIGNWRLEKIEWDRVWLRAGGSRCAVGMNVGAREAGESMGGIPDTPTPTDDSPSRAPAWVVPRELVNAIDKLAEASYAIDRAVVPSLFKRGGDLLAGLRITPVRKNEAVTAIRIEDIKEDSLLDRFGLKNGDALLEINGVACTNLDDTLKALDKARKSERLVARLDRVGKSYALQVVMR